MWSSFAARTAPAQLPIRPSCRIVEKADEVAFGLVAFAKLEDVPGLLASLAKRDAQPRRPGEQAAGLRIGFVAGPLDVALDQPDVGVDRLARMGALGRAGQALQCAVRTAVGARGLPGLAGPALFQQ